jgi:periplasmic divalent cation tolerance protein
MILVITTLGNPEVAAVFGRDLIEQRLAVCVNIIPVPNSIYEWEGRIETAKEVYLIIKTAEEKKLDCIERIKSKHPYKVPALFSIPVESHSEVYDLWIEQQLGLSKLPEE